MFGPAVSLPHTPILVLLFSLVPSTPRPRCKRSVYTVKATRDGVGECENSWYGVEIKCQLDVTEVFIADLIACSTCFGAPLCPSSAAQEYYTVFAACGISCCGFQVAGLVWSWGLCVRFAGCCSILQTGHITLSSTPDQHLENHSTKYHRQQPLYNTLELLMMGIVMPETCWASNKICNKETICCMKLAFYFHNYLYQWYK